MKNKIFSRVLIAVLACALLIPLLSSCTIDNSSYLEYITYIEENCVEWSISDDESKLIGDELVYNRIDTDCKLSPMYAYCFYNTVFTDEDGFYSASVEAPGKEADSEIVWLRGNYDGAYMLYATQKGAEALKEFEEGKYYAAVIIDTESAWNDIGLSVIDEIDAESKNSSEKITADVTDLKNVERLDIRVYDETESFYKTYGALYQMKGNWFYVNYESLGNEHFDADGNFSYRRGSVELSKLSDALSKRIHSFNEEKKVLYTVCTYEDQQYGSYNEYDSYDPTLGIVIFWVVYSLICFALPAAIAVLGCVLARLKPLGRPKYWYIVSLIAVIWIVLSVALMIVILV